jgi:hypothetical protein
MLVLSYTSLETHMTFLPNRSKLLTLICCFVFIFLAVKLLSIFQKSGIAAFIKLWLMIQRKSGFSTLPNQLSFLDTEQSVPNLFYSYMITGQSPQMEFQSRVLRPHWASASPSKTLYSRHWAPPAHTVLFNLKRPIQWFLKFYN